MEIIRIKVAKKSIHFLLIFIGNYNLKNFKFQMYIWQACKNYLADGISSVFVWRKLGGALVLIDNQIYVVVNLLVLANIVF